MSIALRRSCEEDTIGSQAKVRFLFASILGIAFLSSSCSKNDLDSPRSPIDPTSLRGELINPQTKAEPAQQNSKSLPKETPPGPTPRPPLRREDQPDTGPDFESQVEARPKAESEAEPESQSQSESLSEGQPTVSSPDPQENATPDRDSSPPNKTLVDLDLLPADQNNPDHHTPKSGEVAAPEKDEEGRWLIGWDHLIIPDFQAPDLFGNPEPDERPEIEFPESIRALDGEPVSIAGYMVAMKFEKGGVRDFLLSRYVEGCCFGRTPELYEWIFVDVKIPEGAEYDYRTIVVKGVFRLGEKRDRFGFLTSLFQIEATSVEPL